MSSETRPDAVHVDIIGDKNGAPRVQTLGTASILGILPAGHVWTVKRANDESECCGTFHVDVEGGTTHIRCVTSGHTILSGRGLAKTMQMMADMGNAPVIVSHDPGATSAIKNAEYTPSGEFAPVAEVAPVAKDVPYDEVTMGQIEDAVAVVEANGRVFTAEVRNFGPPQAFIRALHAGRLILIYDGDMSRYILPPTDADEIFALAKMRPVGPFTVANDEPIAPVAEVDQFGHCTTGKCGVCADCVEVATVVEDAPGFDEAMAEAEAEAEAEVWAGAGVVRTMTGRTLWTETSNGVTRIKGVNGAYTMWDGVQFAELIDLGVITVPQVRLTSPVRTKLNKSKRKASKVNARRVKGGF